MKIFYAHCVLLLFICTDASGQFQAFDETPYIAYSTPTGVGRSEKMIFEARPTLKLPIYGNLNNDLLKGKKYSETVHIVFDPQFRMYDDNSLPVKMPSYRAFLSAGILRQIGDPNSPRALVSFTVEHGHYSDGQDGCVFGSSKDNDSLCKIYSAMADKINVAQMLNRSSGEYSTDFVRGKLKLCYLLDSINAGCGPMMKNALEVTLGYTRLVDRLLGFDIGGYDDYASKIYPMNQLYGELAFEEYYSCKSNRHYRLSFEYFYRPSDNSFVYAHNFSATAAYFFSFNLGFFVRGEYGQDSYNVRFVDKISRMMLGIAWSMNDRLNWAPTLKF